MSGGPNLPAIVNLNGAWDDTLARLYDEFEQVFKCSPRRTVFGKPLIFDDRVIDSDLEEGFWHVVSRGPAGNRTPDFDRARRIRWIGALRIRWIGALLDGTAPGVSRWIYTEGDGSRKLYYWLEAEKFVLILNEKPRVVVLVSAFYVDKSWTEDDFRKKRAKGTPF